MAKIKASEAVKNLKKLESSIPTFYSNTFPYNCGYIHSNGSKSYDCIGLVKSLINKFDELLNTSPVGDYVIPSQVIPDTTEKGILDLCSGVSKDFKNILPMEYLYMDGHAGFFVGEYTDASGVVNCIECTAAFGGGVKSSYVDAYGRRFNHKGGQQVGTWLSHGKLDKYIDYEIKKSEPKKEDYAKQILWCQIAIEILQGKWGNNPEREKKIVAKHGATAYKKAQDIVNLVLK